MTDASSNSAAEADQARYMEGYRDGWNAAEMKAARNDSMQDQVDRVVAAAVEAGEYDVANWIRGNWKPGDILNLGSSADAIPNSAATLCPNCKQPVVTQDLHWSRGRSQYLCRHATRNRVYTAAEVAVIAEREFKAGLKRGREERT